MKAKKQIAKIIVLTCLLVLNPALVNADIRPDTKPLLIGNELVDGTKIQTYSGVWKQYTIQKGERIDNGFIRETGRMISFEDKQVFAQQQEIENAQGKKVTRQIILDRYTLKPIKIDTQIDAGRENNKRGSVVIFHDKGYVAQDVDEDGKIQSRSIMLPADMYYGMSFGGVIATLPLETGFKVRMPTVFPSWDGMYWLELTVAAEETVQAPDDETLAVYRVDAEWLNLADGEIYPAGPNSSGGAYYILKNNHKDIPRVWRYVTDTYEVIFDRKN